MIKGQNKTCNSFSERERERERESESEREREREREREINLYVIYTNNRFYIVEEGGKYVWNLMIAMLKIKAVWFPKRH